MPSDAISGLILCLILGVVYIICSSQQLIPSYGHVYQKKSITI